MYTVVNTSSAYIIQIRHVWLKLLLKYQIITSALCSLLWLMLFVATVSHDEIFKASTVRATIALYGIDFLPTNVVYGLCFGFTLWWYFRTHSLTKRRFTLIAFTTTAIIAIPISFITHKLWYEGLMFPWVIAYSVIIVTVQILFNTFYLPRKLFRRKV